MITEVVYANGTVICQYPDGFLPRREFYGKDEDVSANADGSYTIITPSPARDAELFYTKNTQRVFMYDEDIHAWWEQ